MNCGNGVSRRPAWLVLVAGLLLTGQAAALPEDRSQPIKVTADSAVQQQGSITYKGSVVIVQGTLKIEADTVVVNHVEGRVQKLTAVGKPARLQQQPEPDRGLVRAHALTIIYFQNESRVDLLRDAQVERDGSTINGDHIEYLVDSETVRARGQTDGGSRVEMVLQPDQPAAPAQPPTPPAESAPETAPAEEAR